ncbi:DUF6879 family protein [uncultured Pseudonocardia sp.]|jgi:hypothetical protein|uniref:DUF6879 family protein n=1 Tax=uncultured Pseudonocardia sp. TaxID=211455 RepID=UPI00261D49FB|nr:DUF6879 family protein [uncultured Pseudonocardia sp.]
MEITADEFAAALATFRVSAFRLEVQPVYIEPVEQELLSRFTAGEFATPDEVPEIAFWFDQVAALTAAGRSITRVRVQTEPPTLYQQFEQWADPWNVAAGEHIRYMSESTARRVGLFPATEGQDWWLLDDRVVIQFAHDSDGRRLKYHRTTDREQIARAAEWRDLAILHSAPATGRSTVA